MIHSAAGSIAMSNVVNQFEAAGFSPSFAHAIRQSSWASASGAGRRSPATLLYVPGRVEVIGKHTDYAGGRSLTCALDRGIVVAMQPRSMTRIAWCYACDLVSRRALIWRPTCAAGQTAGQLRHERRPAACPQLREPLQGADIAFASDLPHAGGHEFLRRLVVATYLALNAANISTSGRRIASRSVSLEDLAGYLGTCENGQSFGTLAGDGRRHLRRQRGSHRHPVLQAGQLSNVHLQPRVRLESRIELPQELAMVIGVSGVVPRRRLRPETLQPHFELMPAIMEVLKAEGWQKSTLAAAIGDDRNAPSACANPPAARAIHSTSRPNSPHARAVAQDISASFPGWSMRSRQRTGRSSGISRSRSRNRSPRPTWTTRLPETSALVRLARELHAAPPAAFGAGFGGSVWAMV